MFNLHRGSSQKQGGSPPRRQAKISEEELRERAMKLNQLFVTFLEIRELDNKMKDKCIRSCVHIEDSYLSTEEKSCLKNCVSKIRPFMKLANENFNEYERESFMGPENLEMFNFPKELKPI